MFDFLKKKEEDETLMSRLGSARKSSPLGFLFFVLFVFLIISGIFYANFKAMGMATGASGPIVMHGLGYTFLQPLYSLWAIYYVLIGHKSG